MMLPDGHNSLEMCPIGPLNCNLMREDNLLIMDNKGSQLCLFVLRFHCDLKHYNFNVDT